MHTRQVWLPFLLGLVVAAIACGDCVETSKAEPAESGRSTDGIPTGIDTSGWTLRRADRAIRAVLDCLGTTDSVAVSANAKIVTLNEDETPYLNGQLIGRPLWHIELQGLQIGCGDAMRSESHPDSRTFDVLTDPIRGTVLKVTSRWPAGRPAMPPTVDAATAAEQMRNAGRETYHGFPTDNPRISFFEAVEILERVGWVPRRAGQVVAEYVMWSRMGEKPRAVWAVMLRGVPVLKPPPGTPKDYQDQYRHIVDAQTGEWLWTTNLPRPARSGSKGE